MAKIDVLLETYGESHQNKTNKMIHWLCVPTIVFTVVGLFYALPWPFGARTLFANWATVLLALSWVYYASLSLPMLVGFVGIGTASLYGAHSLLGFLGGNMATFGWTILGIFVIAWIGQFIGHKIEGKKPSFLQDIQFLMIGPAWLLSFVFNKMGVKYS